MPRAIHFGATLLLLAILLGSASASRPAQAAVAAPYAVWLDFCTNLIQNGTLPLEDYQDSLPLDTILHQDGWHIITPEVADTPYSVAIFTDAPFLQLALLTITTETTHSAQADTITATLTYTAALTARFETDTHQLQLIAAIGPTIDALEITFGPLLGENIFHQLQTTGAYTAPLPWYAHLLAAGSASPRFAALSALGEQTLAAEQHWESTFATQTAKYGHAHQTVTAQLSCGQLEKSGQHFAARATATDTTQAIACAINYTPRQCPWYQLLGYKLSQILAISR